MIFRNSIFSLIALAVFASCGNEKSEPSDPGWNNPGTGSSDNLVVMSYNTRHCAPYYGTSETTSPNENAIASVISAKSPDVVFLQEMDSCTTRSNNVDQPKTIANAAKIANYKFFSFMNYRGGKFGIAILSKMKLLNPQTHALPSVIDNISITSNNAVGTATIQANGQNIFLLCLHLSVYESENKAQLHYVIDNILNKVNMPTIIAGDFNSLPSSSTIKLLTDARFVRTNSNPQNFTIPCTAPNREIDFIAFRNAPKWSINSHVVVTGTNASDHLPIVASLKIEK